VTLARGTLINLGEATAPMPGYDWIHVKQGVFHLAPKMASEFSSTEIAALDRARGITSLSPIPMPAQAVLLGGNTTATAVVTGQRHTEGALTTASGHVDRAVALSYERVKESMRKARGWLKRR
jgi:hypothetical protein